MVRVVPELRWDARRAQRVAGTLLNLGDTSSIDQIEESVDPHRGLVRRDDGPDVDDPPEPVQKRLPILQRDLVNYGHTEGCNTF